MIRNIWAVLCRDILVDQETNSVSCIRCIEEGVATFLPVQIGPVYLGTLWENESKTLATETPAVVRVTLISPGGKKKVLLQTNPLQFNRNMQRLQFRISSIPIEEFGRHQVELSYQYEKQEWLPAALLPLLIRPMASKPQNQV